MDVYDGMGRVIDAVTKKDGHLHDQRLDLEGGDIEQVATAEIIKEALEKSGDAAARRTLKEARVLLDRFRTRALDAVETYCASLSAPKAG